MRTIELDGREMKTKLMTHQYLKEQLAAPVYYGENLDALWDVLASISIPTTIILHHRDALIDHLEGYGENFIDLLCEAAFENEALWVEIR